MKNKNIKIQTLTHLMRYIITSFAFILLFSSSAFAGLGFLDLSIALNIPESVVEAGQPYTNNITITNENSVLLPNVDAGGSKITYNLPTGCTYNNKTGQDWTCTKKSTTVVCRYNKTLKNSQTSSLLTLKINAPSSLTTLDVNSTVTMANSTDPYPRNNIARASIPTGKSNLSANKTASKTSVAIGKSFIYTITANNLRKSGSHTTPIRGLNITDSIPTKLAFNNFGTNNLGCSQSGNSITCYLSSLAVGATKSVDINVTGVTSGTNVVNKATVKVNSSDHNSSLSGNSLIISAQDVNITLPSDIVLTQTLIGGLTNTSAAADSNVTYRLHVANIGVLDAKNVTLSDTIPAGATFVSYSGPWVCNGSRNLSCTLNDTSLDNSESYDLDINVTLPNSNVVIHNDGNISTTSTEKTPLTNNSSSLNTNVIVVGPNYKPADLNISKWTTSDFFATNSTYYYYIGVRNNGAFPAYGAEINDTLPTGNTTFAYVGPLEVQNNNWNCSKSGNLIHCDTNESNFTMNPGYTSGVNGVVRFKVRAPSTHGSVSNTVTVGSKTPDSDLTNNTYTEVTNIVNINLQAIKLVNGRAYGSAKNYVGIDGNLTYKVLIRNFPISGGRVPSLTDVNVTDKLPSNITNLSITTNPRFTCNNPGVGGTLFCTMNNGATTPLVAQWTWTTVATITANAFGNSKFDEDNESKNLIINRFKAETSFGETILHDNAPTTGDGYRHTQTLVRGANMSIHKTASAATIGANQNFTYTLKVKNWPRNDLNTTPHIIPSTVARSIVVKDKLPSDVTFISATGTNWTCSEASHIITCNHSGPMDANNTSSDITVKVTAPDTNNEILTNEANITNATPELISLLSDNNDSATITTKGPDLKIKKYAKNPDFNSSTYYDDSIPVATGGNVDFKISVLNDNLGVAKNVSVTDKFPAGFTDLNVTSSVGWSRCSFAGQTLTCKKPKLDANTSANDIFISAKAPTIPSGKNSVVFTNTADVNTTTEEVSSTNNSDSVLINVLQALDNNDTDLKITKTAIPILPTPNVPFIYIVKVENIGNHANAHTIVMKDKFDSRLVYKSMSWDTNETNVSISCTLPNSQDVISCDISHLSKNNFVDFNITMNSPTVQNNLYNEANVTSITTDMNLLNNEANVTIDTNNTASSTNINESHEKFFHKDISVNKYGNIAVIGNTMLIPSGSTSGKKLNEINSIKQTSSSATLDIIDINSTNNDDNITIEYAGLYWGGHIKGDDKNETGYNVPFNVINFKTPDGTTHIISADKNDTNMSSTASNRVGYYHFKKGSDDNNTFKIGKYRIFYGAKADITTIIRGLTYSNLKGSYTVSNMQVSSGIDDYDWAPVLGGKWDRHVNYGYFGGWSMVVVYSVNHRYHRNVKFKNLSSFSGFRVMLPLAPGATSKLSTTIDGFITPINESIESSLFSFIQGGDKQIPLEKMTITDKNNVQNDIIEGSNNTNNIFNDTITLKKLDGTTIITKTPNENYNVGNDIDQYNLNSDYSGNSSVCLNTNGRPCYLSHKQKSTKVTIKVKESSTISGGEYPSEHAFAQMLSMQTQIYTPDFIDSYKECFKLKDTLQPTKGWVPCSAPTPILRRGSIVKYRITVLNTGDDYARNVYVTDTLPNEVTYEQNSTIATNIYDFNATSPCSDPNYDSNQTIRDMCTAHLKYRVDGNETNSTHILPYNMIDNAFNGTTDTNNTLVFTLGDSLKQFSKNKVAWIEFNTTINNNVSLGTKIKNKMYITFTNPTLADFNLSGGIVTQASLPIESSQVGFSWDDINASVTDIGKNTLGTKIVNQPFELNITINGFGNSGSNNTTIVKLERFGFVDIYGDINATSQDINVTSDLNSSISSSGIASWEVNTSYSKASRAIFFDMNISIHDGNYTESKRYPQDSAFNNSGTRNTFVNGLKAVGINITNSNSVRLESNKTNFTGDVFSTRPKEFNIALSGGTTVGTYQMIKSGKQDMNLTIKALDFYGSKTSEYNRTLKRVSNITTDANNTGINIYIPADKNASWYSINELNISDANFTNGSASINNFGYDDVGTMKLIFKDSNWTLIDKSNNDCNTTVGVNSGSFVSCNTEGNSSSILFIPDHFDFNNTTISNHDNNFTYMIEGAATDLNKTNTTMFAKIITTVKSKNTKNAITKHFTANQFANDVNMSIFFNAISKKYSSARLSILNESNLTNITTKTNIAATNNNLSSTAIEGNFTDGTSVVTLRLAMDRNQTTPQQPIIIDTQDLNGSIHSYLGIAGANVSDANGTDVSGKGDLYFYYGRVHTPDYRFEGKDGNVTVYYEVYCKDCNRTYRNSINIGDNESVDSIYWYINTLHTQPNDGNVSLYNSLEDVTFGATNTSTTSSTSVTNGEESIEVHAPALPYKDKIDMNASSWVTQLGSTDFMVEFYGGGNWVGKGILGRTIDSNISKRQNRRLDW